MHSSVTTPDPVLTATPATIAATSRDEQGGKTTSDCLTAKQVSTQDFYIDTFFNPVWTSGPYVFTFAKDGTIVRPEMYTPEPHPGYHAGRAWWLESANVPYFQASPREAKPWKNVAITEYDDAEFAALLEREGGLGEWQQ